MQEIIIDEEFSRLLPQLSNQQFCDLEEHILEYGCMNPLVLWNGILIDGHNRYNIVTKHNLPFNTISMEFETREEVIIFMIRLQIERRNLNPMELTYLRGLQYNLEKQMHGGDRLTQNRASGQNDHLLGTTSSVLSGQYKVSPRTIRRDGQIAEVIIAIGKESEEAKHDILSGKTRISRVQLREMAIGTEEDKAAIVAQIVDGTFESTSSGASAKSSSNAADQESMQPWEKEFAKMTDEFRQTLRSHAKTDDTVSVKQALRNYITMLEELYSNI